MGISMKLIVRVSDFFEFTVPKIKVKWSVVQERRRMSINAKNAVVAPDFRKKYKSLVLPYWKKYGVKPSKKAFKVLCSDGNEMDPRYIPNDIWFNQVICHFNHIYGYLNLGDKSIQPLFIPDIKKPEVVFKYVFGVYYDENFNHLDESEACRRLREAGKVVVKQSHISSGGEGVRFIDANDMTDEELLKFLKSIKEDFIVQKMLRQHKVLSDINSSSVNTIRIVTLFYKGEVHILSAVLRMGSGGSQVDNVTQGGFACKVHNDGRLDKYAISRKYKWNAVHPGGTVFEEVVIPDYHKIIEAVKNAAKKIPFFKIIGWDIAIDEDGNPVVIEYNTRPEQNQMTCGPTFGDLTDDILDEVFLKK